MQANEYFVTHQENTSIQVTIIDMFGRNLLHIGISFHNIACAFIYNLFMCTKIHNTNHPTHTISDSIQISIVSLHPKNCFTALIKVHNHGYCQKFQNFVPILEDNLLPTRKQPTHTQKSTYQRINT